MRLLKCCSGVFLTLLFSVFVLCTDLINPTATTSTADDISFSVNQAGSCSPSSPYTLTGTVNSLKGLDSIVISFRDQVDTYYDTTVIPNSSGRTSYDLRNSNFKLTVNSSDCNGAYSVIISAYSAVETRTVTINVEVNGATDCTAVGNPVLTLGALSGSSSITPGSPKVLTGSVSCTDCDAAVSLDVTVKDSLGAVVMGNSITASVTKGTDAYTVTVEAKSSACNGTYTIVITAQSGIVSKTVSKTVTVSEAYNCNVQTGNLELSNVLVLGAQNASFGSSLDIDSFNVLTKNSAKARDTAVDLIIGYFTEDNAMMCGSPKWADSSSLAVADGWTGYSMTQFQEISPNINLNTATTVELQSLWDIAGQTKPGVKLASGKQYITVTSQGAIAVIEVVALTNSISGSVSIRVGRTWKGITSVPELFVPKGLVVSATLTVGADENSTYGSSIDLDEPKVMLVSAAKEAAAKVDLIYVYSFAADEDVLGSPKWADESDFSFVAGWSKYNDTKFYKITNAKFESITTRAELEALWQETLAIDPSVPVATDDVVIAKTDMGTIVLIRIVSHTPGATGQIEIKVAK